MKKEVDWFLMVNSIRENWRKFLNIGDEPLDGDDVKTLLKYFAIIINYFEGNLNDAEYVTKIKRINTLLSKRYNVNI